MIDRSFDVEEVERVTEPYRHELLGFHPKEWLDDMQNYCFSDGAGNISLFERGSDGIYTGHYFFAVRGREALKLGKEMLTRVFEETSIKVIRGLTPLQKLGARWMSRQLGFKSYGVVGTDNGPCELFILIKE